MSVFPEHHRYRILSLNHTEGVRYQAFEPTELHLTAPELFQLLSYLKQSCPSTLSWEALAHYLFACEVQCQHLDAQKTEANLTKIIEGIDESKDIDFYYSHLWSTVLRSSSPLLQKKVAESWRKAIADCASPFKRLNLLGKFLEHTRLDEPETLSQVEDAVLELQPELLSSDFLEKHFPYVHPDIQRLGISSSSLGDYYHLFPANLALIRQGTLSAARSGSRDSVDTTHEYLMSLVSHTDLWKIKSSLTATLLDYVVETPLLTDQERFAILKNIWRQRHKTQDSEQYDLVTSAYCRGQITLSHWEDMLPLWETISDFHTWSRVCRSALPYATRNNNLIQLREQISKKVAKTAHQKYLEQEDEIYSSFDELYQLYHEFVQSMWYETALKLAEQEIFVFDEPEVCEYFNRDSALYYLPLTALYQKKELWEKSPLFTQTILQTVKTALQKPRKTLDGVENTYKYTFALLVLLQLKLTGIEPQSR